MSRLVGDAVAPYILQDGAPPKERRGTSNVMPPIGVATGPSRLLLQPDATARITTFAANTYPATSFFDTFIPSIHAENTRALVLKIDGYPLVGSVSVTAGHKHNHVDDFIAWQQVATLHLHNEGAAVVGSPPDECYDALLLTSATTVNLAKGRIWCNVVRASKLRPRIRVTHDSSPSNVTVTLTLTYRPITSSAAASAGTSVFTFVTDAVRTSAWVDAVPIDLSAMSVDASLTTHIAIAVELTGILSAATQQIAIHEIQWGAS